jgi:hypothetical protein
MTATTIIVSAPGGGGMVSSSQQIQNYNLFAVTSSANTFYGNQIISGALGVNGSANEPIVINSTNATTLNTSYRYNNGTQLGYIGTGQGLVTGGGSTIFAIRSENSMAFSVNGGTIAQTITSAGQTQITGSFEVNGTAKTRSTNYFNGGTTYLSTAYLGTTTFFRDDVSGAQNYGGSTIRIAGGTGTSAAGIQFGDVSSNATGARGRIGFLASANNGNPKEFAIIKGVLDSTGANTCNGSLTFHTLNGDNASEASLRMTIDGSGNIGATSGTNIYNASDVRLKQNISSISGSLNSVLSLNPVKFNWIDDFVPSENGKHMLGFVAQEVQTIVPEAVESFGADSIFVGETEIDNPLRVNEKFLIPVLTKAIQEQQAIIDSLIARIETLENN